MDGQLEYLLWFIGGFLLAEKWDNAASRNYATVLSCVVINGFTVSDWSTQNWSVAAVKIRVDLLPQHGGTFVVEASPIGTDP